MEAIKIQTSENPERYQYFDGKYIYLCQVEDDEYTLTITKTKDSKKAKGKAKVLYEGNTVDFCYDYNGRLEYRQLDIEMAFRNFLTK